MIICEFDVLRRDRVSILLTSGGGLARIDVADNDHVDVHLFLTVGEAKSAGRSSR